MLLHYFQQGGPMMWLLLVCSVALVAVILERLAMLGLTGLQQRWQSQSVQARLMRRRRQKPGPSRRSRATGRRGRKRGGATAPLLNVEVAGNHSWVIHPFFWEIPPQIGLLGTVIGLVQIFQGNLSSQAFGQGVGVACLTTIFGIGIAMIARTASYMISALAGQTPRPIGGDA